MVSNAVDVPRIETLRAYSAQTINALSDLITSGAPARPDPRRAGFYEIESASEVFYVHISPVNGRVLLIGVWHRTTPRLAGTTAQIAQVA
jgi:hypothetical protein